MTSSDCEKIERLISALSQSSGRPVDRQQLAQDVGISKSTLADWIGKVRAQGVEIEDRLPDGYLLARTPDLLLPVFIHAQLKTRRFGRLIHHYFQVNSTNDVAHKMAQDGAEEGTLLLAEEQTQGRGRLGRSWFSEKNVGIYASLILRPRMQPRLAPILNLAAAVAAHEAIEKACGITTDIKWPNDLLLNGRKCCGILTEMSAELDQISYVIVGIGINVNHRQFPEHLGQQASSLFLETHQPHSRIGILCRLLESFEAIYQMVEAGATTVVIEQWVQRSSYASGKRVRVDLGGGEISGVTVGLGKTGTLRVRLTDGRIEEVMSSDVVAWR
jgi:BirA family biotin operon repressor/biotin-[acetyl-CoA-carboxylase] ligase